METGHCSSRNEHCKNGQACAILGQCIYEHEIFKDNPQATSDLRYARRLPEILKVLHVHTKKRVCIGSWRGRGQFIHPGSRKLEGKAIEKTIQQVKRKERVKEYKMMAWDPLTLKMYRERMKRIAEQDAAQGYIYDERERHNFNE